MLTHSVLKIGLSEQMFLILLLLSLIALLFAIHRVDIVRRIDSEDWCLLVDIITDRSRSSLRWQRDHVGIGLIAEDEALAHQECLLAEHRSLLDTCNAAVLTTREGGRWRGDSHLLRKLAGLEGAH